MDSQRDHSHQGEDGWEWGEAQRICLRLAYRYAKNPSEAEDIAQEALLRAWRRRSTLRDAANRKGWLAAIIRNEAWRYYSRPRPDPTDLLEYQEGSEDALVVSTVERADLHAALELLSERERTLISLRYVEDLTQPAIAARLGIPEGTVKVQLHRARVKLRRAYALDG
ncbi:MAG: sigma-70 family RNA polymerase sigma factor [Actinobacteria bacterium]|nr:sigma-70 family RNA polymerase sigma factor [Actinomycetota bacterium]